MNYQEVVEYLFNLKIFGMDLRLERIRHALDEFGNPEKDLKIIHVAGTNGKGSTAAMITSILQQAGLRVGLFTSPHLIDFRERIRINDELISEEDVVKIFNKINEKKIKLTYFEFLTLLALIYFKEKNVSYAILESGLGGTLDATNIANSIISVLTPISLDHTHILGNTVEQITEDKSNIIKPNSICVTGFQDLLVLDIIKRKAEKKKAKFIEVTKERETNLLGDFQRRNASLAWEVAKQLKIPEDKIKIGLQKVNWLGRIHYLEDNLLVDSAHNNQGLEQMRKYVESLKRDLIIIFGATGNRDAKDMISRLPKYKTLIFTVSPSSNATDQGHLKAIDPDKVDVTCLKIKDLKKAIKYAKEIQKDELILVTGSVYLVGDVMKEFGLGFSKK